MYLTEKPTISKLQTQIKLLSKQNEQGLHYLLFYISIKHAAVILDEHGIFCQVFCEAENW